MKKKRLIPVLLLKNGFLVQSKGFCRYQNIGNPITAVRRMSDWASDELIYLDITSDDIYDIRREDLRYPNRGNIIDILNDVSKECYMPITVGGKIRSLDDISIRLKSGADKIAINTKALEDPSFITQAAKEFGSQCIIVSIDAKLSCGSHMVMSRGGKTPTGYDASSWAKKVEDCGAGEILINSIDRDGMRSGYDIDLIGAISKAVRIPVIACGGVGEWEHLAQALNTTAVDAVAAANIFHYIDQSVYLAKKYLYEKGCNVRNSELFQNKEEIIV
ncbi:MAG: imidazole glycerol phosphate synthase cyclase subunit [Candidatus Omnitrophota bacterium]|nr:imidazole glycerol phosphate synthase cyclase subunit [Candidatus Omnitrophota bacterium]